MTIENNTHAPVKVEETRKNVWVMFDRIAHRYDLLNRLLSFRQDVAWRNKLTRFLPNRNNLVVLDVATGTGDVLISLLKKSPKNKISKSIGIDMAVKMLEFGRPKIKKLNLDDKIELHQGNATDIQFNEGTFDVATISFGIRNVNDLDLGIQNMYRVLKPGGRVLILEFSLPQNILMKKLYLFYFRKILPFIGGAISGDSYAYNYLNQSVESFPYGDKFCEVLQRNGFNNVKYQTLTFGIASIYQGDKE
ncbi:MAG: bifunctional demethylmenaquinone methyltransferase/2-methoxy-6-polyprenyl-1,4-benzoquinol methylase UbiE [Calditrichaeota bacterium]|nr:MAG: bifunctional demethylmenaquinone methyltransferase/2-methoxy-6-polyprenyl-1,4-benzoquinol methylase UbiE [Calditrichota bacterium]MBL1205555.1 bifunctional demethylmenaquinone methyltransferase/2-methoxy-6-polyprenyl-1,4-benzoquinol methylase UbiE [Calditrichota bacterium]NOG45384.1 bifunctional demethylmenaquinone methyltransferase/2-methoxy-6-polyprenyl-1,4-benzoquinol methylase UbiE [Calditrichota bacterium]